jgi:DNA-binding HxlR family transcriptional regulator
MKRTLDDSVSKCNYVEVDDVRDFPRDSCAVAGALDYLGDRWTMLVLRESFFGVRRFEQMLRNTGAARNILTNRLGRLVDAEILEKRLYSERPPRYEYRLTEKGVDLWPVIISLAKWGGKWAELDTGPAIALEHKGCGAAMEPALCCPECGELVDARSVRVVPGPAMLAASAGRLDETA